MCLPMWVQQYANWWQLKCRCTFEYPPETGQLFEHPERDYLKWCPGATNKILRLDFASMVKSAAKPAYLVIVSDLRERTSIPPSTQ